MSIIRKAVREDIDAVYGLIRQLSDHDFTKEQRLEYKLYFNLASQLYGWGVQLPIETKKTRKKKVKNKQEAE